MRTRSQPIPAAALSPAVSPAQQKRRALQELASTGWNSRRRDRYCAALSSTYSRCFSRDREGVSGKFKHSLSMPVETPTEGRAGWCRRDRHSAAPPSRFRRRFNTHGEGVSAEPTEPSPAGLRLEPLAARLAALGAGAAAAVRRPAQRAGVPSLLTYKRVAWTRPCINNAGRTCIAGVVQPPGAGGKAYSRALPEPQSRQVIFVVF